MSKESRSGTLSRLRLLGGVALLTLLAGCQTTAPPRVPEEVRLINPTHLPKGTITNFNAALACMDNLMLLHQVAPVYVSSQGIVNYTSTTSLSSGGMEMLITALSKMAIRSNGVRFVNYNSDIQNMMTLQGAHPNNADFRVPDYFIRGGITQHNKSLWSGQRGSGASVELEEPDIIDGGTFFTLRGQEDISASDSASATYGTLTLDLSAGFISTLQIVPGAASANTLALENMKGKATNIDLTIGDIGYTYSFSDSLNYDFNTLLRSLIEVGAIEIIGKLQKVPYWRCLAQAGAMEDRDQELAQHYLHLRDHQSGELVTGAQRVLSHLSYYDGPQDGHAGEALQEAVQSYQQHMGLTATGEIDFATFRMMNLFTPSGGKAASLWWMPLPGAQPVKQAAAASTSTGSGK